MVNLEIYNMVQCILTHMKKYRTRNAMDRCSGKNFLDIKYKNEEISA